MLGVRKITYLICSSEMTQANRKRLSVSLSNSRSMKKMRCNNTNDETIDEVVETKGRGRYCVGCKRRHDETECTWLAIPSNTAIRKVWLDGLYKVMNAIPPTEYPTT